MKIVADRALGDTSASRFETPEQALMPVVAFLETANRHKDAGTRLPRGSRMKTLKSMVIRAVRMFTTEQAAFNEATLAVLHALDYNVRDTHDRTERRLERLEEAVAGVVAFQRELAAQFDRLNERLTAVENNLRGLAQGRAADHTELMMQRSRLNVFLEEARRRLPEPLDTQQAETFGAELEAFLAPLYAQLEDRFRGSREHVLEMQKEYLPDILGLSPGAVAIDIGCGRGEWLELLGDHGVEAYGVDMNASFVAHNAARGLDVRLEDALEHLHAVEPASIGAVTAFHVIEHMDFPDAVRLVDAALVALRPGGLLIFETPNPTNLLVGASLFYIDPTHRNPVHPEFLEFLVEARGFTDVEVRFLHPSTDPRLPEPPDPASAEPVRRLNEALFGAHDYAVVGRKPR